MGAIANPHLHFITMSSIFPLQNGYILLYIITSYKTNHHEWFSTVSIHKSSGKKLFKKCTRSTHVIIVSILKLQKRWKTYIFMVIRLICLGLSVCLRPCAHGATTQAVNARDMGVSQIPGQRDAVIDEDEARTKVTRGATQVVIYEKWSV